MFVSDDDDVKRSSRKPVPGLRLVGKYTVVTGQDMVREGGGGGLKILQGKFEFYHGKGSKF